MTIVLLLAPLALILAGIIAVAIVIDSPGSVLYWSERIGRGGRRFRMVKFRTMHRHASGPSLRAAADERHTRVGHLLTQSRLDELPQLWHVLTGEMRLVGPRPELPEFVAEHPEAYAEILDAPPGLTGITQLAFADEGHVLAQVGPDQRRDAYVETLLPQKVEMDLAYVRGRQPVRDLRILAETVLVPIIRALNPNAAEEIVVADGERSGAVQVGVRARLALIAATVALTVLYVQHVAAG